jgi:Cu/Ag efflux protein CusF
VDGPVSRGRSLAVAAVLFAVAPTHGQQLPTDPVPAAAASIVRITASVESVDPANRTVTLKGPRGRIVTLPVGAEVPQLEQVKPGDIVVVRYLEALALELKRGGPGPRTETPAGTVASPGERPAPAETRQVTVVADIIGVDPRRQLVTLRAGRRAVEMKVRDPNQMKVLKVGDQVEAIYTEALVVAIEPAPRAARATQVGS